MSGAGRQSLSRLLALGLLVVTVLAVAWRIVPALRWADRQADATSGLSSREKELVPARGVDLDPAPIERAKALIPPGAAFAVVVSDAYPFTYEISRTSAPTFAAYWLLPRPLVQDARAVRYVVNYGVDPRTLGVSVAGTADLGQGVTLLRTEP